MAAVRRRRAGGQLGRAGRHRAACVLWSALSGWCEAAELGRAAARDAAVDRRRAACRALRGWAGVSAAGRRRGAAAALLQRAAVRWRLAAAVAAFVRGVVCGRAVRVGAGLLRLRWLGGVWDGLRAAVVARRRAGRLGRQAGRMAQRAGHRLLRSLFDWLRPLVTQLLRLKVAEACVSAKRARREVAAAFAEWAAAAATGKLRRLQVPRHRREQLASRAFGSWLAARAAAVQQERRLLVGGKPSARVLFIVIVLTRSLSPSLC